MSSPVPALLALRWMGYLGNRAVGKKARRPAIRYDHYQRNMRLFRIAKVVAGMLTAFVVGAVSAILVFSF